MSNAWEKWKESVGETRPWHLLVENAKEPDTEKVKKRMDICNACPELIKLTSQCKKCGCFMKAKTQLQAAKCPLSKW